MGRQINFYMTGEDEAEFIKFIKADRDAVIMAYSNPTDEPIPLDSLPSRDIPGWFALWLWDRTNSPVPILRYVPEQKYYVVDRVISEVIEFSRSYFADKGLIRGRIWAEMEYWDLEQNLPHRVFKSEDFKKWFNKMASWIKHKGIKNEHGDYVLPGATSYKTSGGHLCQLNMAPNVKYVYH